MARSEARLSVSAGAGVAPAWRSRHRPRIRATRLARIRLAVYERADYRCQHCHTQFDKPDGYDGRGALSKYATRSRRGTRRTTVIHNLELDHIVPYSLGGKFELGNLQALCSACNSRKGAQA